MAKITIFDGARWDSQFFGIQDALKVRPPTEYIIEDIFPRSSLTIFYGAPGSFKTNLLIDACMCVMLGLRWLAGDEFDGFKVEKSPALWIDADSGIDLLHERFGASAMYHAKNANQRGSAQLHYASFLDPTFSATEDAAVTELIQRVLKWNVGIIVFDNLGTISGGAEENTSQMIPICNRLRFIATKTRAAVIAIHHVAKNGDTDRKSSRGHGSIDASADNAFFVEADDNVVNIHQTKARRHRIPTFGALFEYEHRGKTKDLATMNFIGIEPELPAEYVKAKRIIVEYFSKHKEANQSELITLLSKSGIGNHKARSILHTFVRCNLLQLKSGHPHNQKVFSLLAIEAKLSIL